MPIEVLHKSNIYLHNGRGVEGHQILMVKLKIHKKGIHSGEDLKKNVVYWMERAIRFFTFNVMNFQIF